MMMKPYIEKCIGRVNLTVAEASAALDLIMTNQATEAEIAGLLVSLRAKGETVEEIVGFAQTMRDHAIRITVDDPEAIDMCGTGGDGLGTFNISTVATLVAAGAGATVAKHGNRSVSSRSGSADLLAALGVDIQSPPAAVQDCVNAIGVGFLFAPLFHPAMKFVAKARSDLALRTIFNMLGPLTNPAGVRRQVVGTFSLEVTGRLAEALHGLGTRRAYVLHSKDGMDEVSLSAETDVFEVRENSGSIRRTLTPEDFNLPRQPVSVAQGGTVEQNAVIARAILNGEKIPPRDLVLANAAMGLMAAGKCSSVSDGAQAAAESIDSGRAMQKLKQLVEVTNRK